MKQHSFLLKERNNTKDKDLADLAAHIYFYLNCGDLFKINQILENQASIDHQQALKIAFEKKYHFDFNRYIC